MAERRGQAATASNQADPASNLPVHNTNDVTVEYIKENDFGPHRVKKYSPRSLGRPKRVTGKGYYVTHESESFVRKVVEKAAAATHARTLSTRTRRSGGGNADTDSIDSPETPKNTKADQDNKPQSEVPTTPAAEDVQKETSGKSNTIKVDPAKSVVVPATSASTKSDAPKPDAPKAAGVRRPGANMTKSIHLPVAARVSPHTSTVTPQKSSNLVADTISSLLNLFGERRRQHGGGPAPKPTAARSSSANSAKIIDETTPTAKRRVGRTAVATVTPPTKNLTDYQTNDVVKRTASIATTEVQIKSTVSQAAPAMPAAATTPRNAGGRVARKRVGVTPDTMKTVGSATRSAVTATPPDGAARKTVESTVSTDNQVVKEATTPVSTPESLTTAVSHVVSKTVSTSKTSIEKKTVSKGRAAPTTATPAKHVENSAVEEAHTTIATDATIEEQVSPSAPSGPATNRRGRAAGRTNNTVAVTVTPAKTADNSADQENVTTITARANIDDQPAPETPTVGRKVAKRGNRNTPATAVSPAKIGTTNSEGISMVSHDENGGNSSNKVSQKTTTMSAEEPIGSQTTSTIAVTTTKRGRGRPAAARTQITVAATPAESIGVSVTEVTPEPSATIESQVALQDTPPTTVAKRGRGNSGKRKASPEKEDASEGKKSARSVNLAKRVAAKASKGNARKRARTTAEESVPVEQGTVDITPEEQVKQATVVITPQEKVKQAVVDITPQKEVKQAILVINPQKEVKQATLVKTPQEEVKPATVDKTPQKEVKQAILVKTPQEEVKPATVDRTPQKEAKQAIVDITPQEEVKPAALDEDVPPTAAVDATDSSRKISQALMIIQATVSQEVKKLVQSDATPSIPSHLKEKIVNKGNSKSSASKLQQSLEEELDESSEEVTGKGTNAQKKRRMRKPVAILKTFPLRSRPRIESDSEEEDCISHHEDEQAEPPAPNVKMDISVQKRILVQSDNNPVAETVPPAQELLEIGVRVKKRRGRPPGKKSQQDSGGGVQAATDKQPPRIESHPEEEDGISDHEDEQAEPPAPNVKMDISVQKRIRVQSDNNPVAETVPPAQELLEIGVRVKKRRGRPPGKKSQQDSGGGVQAATDKQPPRIESHPEEEDGISDHKDEQAEPPAPNVKMDISVQKRILVQSDNNPVAETVPPAQELLGIGVRVKKRRGRPPGKKSQQVSGGGVQAATDKQAPQSTPKARVVRKRRGRSANKGGPEVPSDMIEDDESICLVSVDGSTSVISVDESISMVSVDESVSLVSVESGEISSKRQTLIEKISGPDMDSGQEKKGRTTRRNSQRTMKGLATTSKQPLHSTPKPDVVRKLRDRSAKKAALEVPSDATEDDGSVSLVSVQGSKISTTLETFLQNISVPGVGSDEEISPDSQIEDSIGGADLLDEDLDSDEDVIIPDGGKDVDSEPVMLGNETEIKRTIIQKDTQVEAVPERGTNRQFKESGLKRDLHLAQSPGVAVIGVFPPRIQRLSRSGRQTRSRPVLDASEGNTDETDLSIRDNESELSHDLSLADVDERSDSIVSTEDLLDGLSVQSDQSSLNSFSFRTPMQKGPSRKRKRKTRDESAVEPPSKSTRIEEKPAAVTLEEGSVGNESMTRRLKAQLAYEERFGLKRVGTKVECPDCGLLVGPFYLQRHRKSDRCTPHEPGTDTKPEDLSVETDTSLVSVEGTPKPPVTPKQPRKLKALKQAVTPSHLGTPTDADTPSHLGTPTDAGTHSREATPVGQGKPCSKCGRLYKSLVMHEKWCGRETVREECKICQQEILVKKMDSHLLYCRPRQPPEEPELAEDGTERKGRKAARKAMSNIHSLILSMGKPEQGAPTVPKKPRYMTPVQVTKYLRKKWERDLVTDGEILCPLSISASHCGFVAESVAEVSSHYVSCPYHKKTYKCMQCSHEATTNQQAKRHARTHTWSDDDSEDDMSDAASIPDDEDDDPDVAFSDDSGSEKNSTTRRRLGMNINREKRKKMSDSSKKSHFAERLEMFQDALDWTLDWRQRNQPGELGAMAGWAPRAATWHPLNTSEAIPYLPASMVSPWFSYHARGSDRIQTNLTRFESIIKPLALLNVGGPVWALDWLPTPIGESCTQYLAVYCHRQHDKHHSVMKATSGLSAIQIWSCQTMHLSKLTAAPKLCLLLAQNDGAIWCMKWSPRRTWPREDETLQGRLPWLGTLAVATSNGKVNIYSIPVPESLPKGEDDTDLPVYKVTPVLTLELQSLDNKAAVLQNCRCLDWQYLGGCHRLLAGYAGGQVALYDLLTSSPLLLTRGTGDKPDVLRPLVSFMAHGCPVTSLAFCQRRPTFFTTVSQDRQMKVWNVEHLEYPVNAVAKSEYTKVVWPLHWATIFAATDNCYCLEHNALFMIDTGYFGIQNRPLTVHNGSIMDACYSDWLNTCLSVDSSGVVEAMYLPYLMLTHKHHKSFSSRRMVMFEVKTEPLHACECDPSVDPPAPTPSCTTQRLTCPVCHRPLPVPAGPAADPATAAIMSADEEDGRQSPTLLSSVKKVMRSMEVTTMPARPRTVTEMIQKYAVVFEDRCMNNLNTRKDTRIRSAKDLRPDLLLPPLASQHKAEWNPNLGSHLWAAVGGEAGLLRLVHFSAFGSKQEQAFVKKVFSEKNKDKQCGYTTEPL